MNNNSKSVLLTIANAREPWTAYKLFHTMGLLGIHQLYLGKLGRFTLQAVLTIAAIWTIIQPTIADRVQDAFAIYSMVLIGLLYDWVTLWWQVRRVNVKVIERQARADDKAEAKRK